jgi:hypothetical protein
VRGLRPRALVAALAALVVAAAPMPWAAADGHRQSPPEVVLASQSTLVDGGGTYTAAIRVDGLPTTDAIRLTVHDRVRSRSELATAGAGKGLRTSVATRTIPLAELPPGDGGTRVVSLPLVDSAGRSVSTPGVYPVEVVALDPDGDELDDVVTVLVVRPPASDSTPPLAVAVLAEVGTDPARPPKASNAAALAEVLGDVGGVATTLAVGPAYADDLAAQVDDGDADARAALEALRATATDHPLLDLPYVPTSPDGLAADGLDDVVASERKAGTAALQSVLGTTPSQHTWVATNDLGAVGLRALADLGLDRVLVSPSRVERVADGVLTPARPFALAPPRDGSRRPTGPAEPVRALVTDTRLTEALRADGPPALVAARAVGELAMLWFEQPGVARAVVAPVDPSIDPAAVRGVLDALAAPELFHPVSLDAAFDAADPLEGSRGSLLRRALVPDGTGGLPGGILQGVLGLRAERASLIATVGSASRPEVVELDRHLLRATAAGLGSADRGRELAAARAAIDGLADSVSTAPAVTITLTARSGTLPLTIHNDSGGPIKVRLEFRSPKLELPGGDTRDVTLTDQTTRLDVDVRTRSSGAFEVDVDVLSPDGALTLATTRFSVRSTAVSGVGLVLSIGAALFLAVWWARHWRQRRNEKLVDGAGRHPTSREPDEAGPAR